MYANEKIDLNLAKARSSYASGDNTTALDYLVEILKIDKTHPDALYLTGMILATIGNYESASASFVETIHSIESLNEINSLKGALGRLKEVGFHPETILDIGAYDGAWAGAAMKFFPESSFILVEAQPGKEHFLTELQNNFPETVTFHMALLGAEAKDRVPFFLMETGSSVFEEQTSFDRKTIELPMQRLDTLISAPKGPVLMKLDVQGSELDVLKGSSGIFEPIEVIIMECAILEYNKGAPQLDESISYMKGLGFRPLDIFDLTRGKDGALFHMDVVFVREGSSLIPSGTLW